jgi:transmembrane 9 superfamily protein 2/4
MRNKFFLLILSLFFTLFEKIISKRPKKSYRNGEKVNLISGTVNSFKTQIPFDLYYLDVCVPEDVLLIPSNLGETLLSGKSYQTSFELSINESKVDQLLCTKKISKTAFKRINNLIQKEYFVNYFLDNLPGGLAHTYFNTSTKEIRYSTGVPIGFVKNNQAYINNYFRINVQLNKINLSVLVNKTKRDDDDEYVDVPAFDIISFTIEPFSIKMNNVNDKINKIINSGIEYENQIFNVSEDIIFRYDTFYTYTDTIYEERYFKFFYGNKFIHTNSVYISGLIIVILLIILSYIYFRAIKSESEIHNEKVTSEESINEYGWRNIAFDVFRRPIRSDILSSLIGTGIQLLIMLLYSLSFVVLGIIQPKSGGSYFTLLAMVYIFLSLISGYSSARFYKMVHGLNWLRVCIFTAIFFPMTLILSLSSNFLK